MPNYLLDTNHASPLVTLGHPLRERVLQRLDAGEGFAICVPVLAETLFGIGILPRAAQNLVEWQRLQPFLPCMNSMPSLRRSSKSRYAVTVGSWRP